MALVVDRRRRCRQRDKPLNQARPAGAKRGRTLIGTLTGLTAVILIAGLIGLGWVFVGDSLDQTLMALVSLAIAGAIAWALLRYAGTRLAASPWRMQELLNV